MKKIGIFFAIFAASLLGVLVAFQIERRLEGGANSARVDDNWPFVAPTSASELPPGPPDFVAPAKKIMPSVVSVDQRVREHDLFSDREFVETAGSGSGVIISQSGLILTNNHVVAGGDILVVRTGDNRTFQAKVVGTDPTADLAVIKINATNLVPAELGDSDKLQVGQWVLAVGNPLGYSNTVSAGVVSSLKRTLPVPGETGVALLMDAIQTDAAINPGNSGGALANTQGQLVGINSAIASTTGGSVGVGFAIPINRAKKVVRDIVKYGHVRYGNPGFTIYQRQLQDEDVQQAMLSQIGLQPPQTGLIVRSVYPGSPAAKAGIRQFDVIESVDGALMRSPIDFVKAFFDKKPGDQVNLKVWDYGKTHEVTIVLEDLSPASQTNI